MSVEASGTEADIYSQEASLTALAVRPVALVASAGPEIPVLLGVGALVSLPNEAPLPAPIHQPRFYLGVVGAPDVSTVKFASVQSPLLNFGVTLEYRLTNRLRLTTGLLRSTKQYTARRENYAWGTFSRQVSLYDFKQVDATCQVLDVPLNLRYDFLTQPQYKVFGSVGLSSFFMQRERYSYPYLYLNMPYYAEWELVNANRHLFSIANLSFGYERNLSNHWSLQAEPYLKLPLGGVGAGRVQLVSGGIFFGAKYGF